jgi:hypothetical protein
MCNLPRPQCWDDDPLAKKYVLDPPANRTSPGIDGESHHEYLVDLFAPGLLLSELREHGARADAHTADRAGQAGGRATGRCLGRQVLPARALT